MRNVNPLDASEAVLGTTGLTATFLGFINVVPSTMASISEFTGLGGIAIGGARNWWNVYSILDNSSKLPNNPTYSGTQDQQFQGALDDNAAGNGRIY